MNIFTRIILLPVYNEEKTLKSELNKLLDRGDLFIIVNDGSTDKSGNIIINWMNNYKNDSSADSRTEKLKLSRQNPGNYKKDNNDLLEPNKLKNQIYKYIKLSENISKYKCIAGKKRSILYIEFPINRGKSSALRECFKIILNLYRENSLKDEGVIIITDADGQLPAEIIRSATDHLKENNLDMLIGKRDFSSYPFIKRLGNYFLSWLASILTGFKFHDTQCGFRIFTVQTLERILPYYHARGYSCEQELSLIPVLLGMKINNTFPVQPVYYRSNSTMTDAFYITLDSFNTWLRVRSNIFQ